MHKPFYLFNFLRCGANKKKMMFFILKRVENV